MIIVCLTHTHKKKNNQGETQLRIRTWVLFAHVTPLGVPRWKVLHLPTFVFFSLMIAATALALVVCVVVILLHHLQEAHLTLYLLHLSLRVCWCVSTSCARSTNLNSNSNGYPSVRGMGCALLFFSKFDHMDYSFVCSTQETT